MCWLQVFIPFRRLNQGRGSYSHKIWPNDAEIGIWSHTFSASNHRKPFFFGAKRAPHKNKIGLHGCLCMLLNGLKIPEKGADLRPHSGIQLPKSFQLQGASPPDQRLCPWTRWGLCLLSPYGSCSVLTMWLAQLMDIFRMPGLNQ